MVRFPSSFQNIDLKVKKKIQKTKFFTFSLSLCQKRLFKGKYLNNSLGNLPSKFYHDLYLPKKTWKMGLFSLEEFFYFGIDFASTYCVFNSLENGLSLFKNHCLWWEIQNLVIRVSNLTFRGFLGQIWPFKNIILSLPIAADITKNVITSPLFSCIWNKIIWVNQHFDTCKHFFTHSLHTLTYQIFVVPTIINFGFLFFLSLLSHWINYVY